ncbi:hypothetical protein AB0K16_22110 [Nonomuraea jabiensis]|uniref:hypothetical protein n=1 Tax=Nonomuraea jabiensis TaxID=882448 RepID=UPI0034303867
MSAKIQALLKLVENIEIALNEGIGDGDDIEIDVEHETLSVTFKFGETHLRSTFAVTQMQEVPKPEWSVSNPWISHEAWALAHGTEQE